MGEKIMEINAVLIKSNGETETVTRTVPDDWYSAGTEEVSDTDISDALSEKADRADLQAIWDEMAEAYTNGVNSI